MQNLWVGNNFSSFPYIVLSGTVIFFAILLFTRMAGLRSFSKMSASDFAMTVAVGSLFGSVISQPSPSIINGIMALGFLFLSQFVIALLRRKTKVFKAAVDNNPILLMKDGEFLSKNLNLSNVTEADVIAKLREANVLSLENVRAVVFETTGDISVLHGNPQRHLSPILLKDVRI